MGIPLGNSPSLGNDAAVKRKVASSIEDMSLLLAAFHVMLLGEFLLPCVLRQVPAKIYNYGIDYSSYRYIKIVCDLLKLYGIASLDFVPNRSGSFSP